MATIQLPPEFKRLLNSLNAHGVEYLLVGGYAVIFHGYVRTTGDIDIWISASEVNAARIDAAVHALGFNPPWLKPEIFLKARSVLRIGTEPFQFEIINQIDGVAFEECYGRRVTAEIEGIPVPVIGLADLKRNKRASGRNKDLADLDYLP